MKRVHANKKLVEEFFKLINSMGNDKELIEAFNDQLRSEHRTIKQSAMRVLKAIIENYAENDLSDLRNEDSLNWAKKVAKLKDEHFLPYV